MDVDIIVEAADGNCDVGSCDAALMADDVKCVDACDGN